MDKVMGSMFAGEAGAADSAVAVVSLDATVVAVAAVVAAVVAAGVAAGVVPPQAAVLNTIARTMMRQNMREIDRFIVSPPCFIGFYWSFA